MNIREAALCDVLQRTAAHNLSPSVRMRPGMRVIDTE